MFCHRKSELLLFQQLIPLSVWIIASQRVASPVNPIHHYRNENIFVKRQLKWVPAMDLHLRLHLSAVLGFFVPPGGSSRNWDEIIIVGWFYDSLSDLPTATGCYHHTRNCVIVITGSCDLLSFESLRIFAIWWSSLLKCNLYIMVAVLTHTLTLTPSLWKGADFVNVEKDVRTKKRIEESCQRLDVYRNVSKTYNSISSFLVAELYFESHWNAFRIR